MRYRIHENNQVGLRKLQLNRFESSALQFIHQASYLSEVSKQDLSEENQLLLNKFISVLQVNGKKQKAKVMLSTKLHRHRLIDQVGFKVVFLILIAKGKIQ